MFHNQIMVRAYEEWGREKGYLFYLFIFYEWDNVYNQIVVRAYEESGRAMG